MKFVKLEVIRIVLPLNQLVMKKGSKLLMIRKVIQIFQKKGKVLFTRTKNQLKKKITIVKKEVILTTPQNSNSTGKK